MIDHGPRDVSRVALTFDDGPGPDTPALLDALRAGGAAATFFLHGRNVAQHPALVRRVRDEGHELGNHALTHENLRRHPVKTVREVVATQRLVADAAGVRPRVFRPPYGAGGAAARLLRLPVIGWDVDPRDWTRPGPDAIVERVLANVRPGSIVLLHDGRGYRDETVAAVPRILEGLSMRRLEPVTVSELLSLGA